MDNTTLILIALGALNAVLLITAIVLLARPSERRIRKEVLRVGSILKRELDAETDSLRDDVTGSQAALRQELTQSVQSAVSNLGAVIAEGQRSSANMQEERLRSFETGNDRRLEEIRETMERRVTAMQEDNGHRLDEMRGIIDEKLQKTIETRMTESFRLVSERLEQVYRGLGEMQTLATGVGDLKKVLSNVKARGILGEIQLGAILKEFLAPEQYIENAVTVPGSAERVEFAVKLPVENGESVLLPIDAKFPGDCYAQLQDAYASGDKERVTAAAEQLKRRLRSEAKDIREKYIDPPHTTEFGILFLPFEGLYAEAVNRGMIEELQTNYRVSIAGPGTMAALLNTLQMGFKTVAIQRRSGEVWEVLGAVRTEFERFGDVLAGSQKKLLQVNDDLDALIGKRSRAIMRKLRSVERLEDDAAARILGSAESGAFLPSGSETDADEGRE